MPETALIALPKPTSPLTDANREASQSNRKSMRQTLAQAVKLKDLTYQAALELEGQVCDPEDSRARARALTDLIKAWDTACTRIRIQLGKPNPGQLRPESKPKKVKRTKPQQTLLDQDQPACGPSHTAAPATEQSQSKESIS